MKPIKLIKKESKLLLLMFIPQLNYNKPYKLEENKFKIVFIKLEKIKKTIKLGEEYFCLD